MHQACEVIQRHQTIDRMGSMIECTQRVKMHNGMVGKNGLRRETKWNECHKDSVQWWIGIADMTADVLAN